MSSVDFLAEGNVAGHNLLRIVSRGSAIIAEILRLSEHIPSVFVLATKADQLQYGELLFDFHYLQNQDLYDNKLAASPELNDLDEELRESNFPVLERFYLVFESIYKYVKDVQRYLEDVEEGVYIQHQIEDILQNDDGKQLLAEMFYNYGVMLTLMDTRIDGLVRERMLVAYYRYKGHSDILSEVCKLCRQTGYSPGNPKRPTNYPEEFFLRFKFPPHIVKMVVSRIRSDDIYNQTKSFPNPEHRSAALASQASMLYIILYFAPEVLHKESATMREIVDKHFSDNWVIPYYMGYIVDLSTMWEPYKAAKAALGNTIAIPNVKEIQQRHIVLMQHNITAVKHYLTEGVLVEDYVLDNIQPLLTSLRNFNVNIRWLTLHRITKNKKLKEVVANAVSADDVLLLLLKVAQFEFKLKNMVQNLLNTKTDRWNEWKGQSHERMTELSAYFSGEQMLTRVQRDEQLQSWFANIATEVQALDYQDSTSAGRKIHQLIQALEEVEQFHQIETNFQVKHFLTDTRGFLAQMLRIVNVKEEIQIVLSVVSDLSYAPELLNDYVGLMHERIKRDPFAVLLLRATFLKLSSYLEGPLVRVNQANSPDLESVAEYYSTKLVGYVRKVLEVIPVNMFLILDQIIQMQTHSLPEIPTRVEKLALKDYHLPEERYKLAKLTHQVSVFTEGILAMETTLMGIIQVDPAELLEDGIRKELVRQIVTALHNILQFRGKGQEFEGRLQHLEVQLEGFRTSFEYISDYVNIYGLKIWQQEFSRIISFNVEQECNSFLKKKIYDWQSEYQNEAIPIPVPPPTDDKSVNFIGRLVRELLLQTDARRTIYLDTKSGWFELTGREACGIRTFSLLQRSVGTVTMCGVDKTMAFMIVMHLQDFVRWYRRDVMAGLKDYMRAFTEELQPTSALPAQGQKLYSTALQRTQKMWAFVTEITSRIGQIQLCRRQITNELNFSCKTDSTILACSLSVLNSSLLNDIREHYRSPDTKPYPNEDNALLEEVTAYLDASGFGDPITKIYIMTDPLDDLPCVMFLFVVAQLSKYTYDRNVGCLLTKQKGEPVDGSSLVIGTLTILKQFHSSNLQKFLAYMSQYIRSTINLIYSKDQHIDALPYEVINILVFLEEFARFASISRKVLEEHVPAYILDRFKP